VTRVKTNTRKWFDKLPEQYRQHFYDNLDSYQTHELWEWIIDMPLRDAEDMLVNLTKDWDDDEDVGTPYKRSMKQ